MALPITVPYVFGNVTSSIPLTNLDADFATVYAAVNGIGNGTVSLANVVITGGSITGITGNTSITGNITVTNSTTTGGHYSQGALGVAFTDGIVMDYATGNGRISVGGGDGITFYTGGVANTSIGSVSSGGAWTLPADASISGLTVGKGVGAISTNTVVGSNALAGSNTGANNAAFGSNVLGVNTSGAVNAGFGINSLAANTTGASNAGFGVASLSANTTGSYNSAVGQGALQNNTTASYNTAVGYQASYNGTTGARNTSLGYQALLNTTTASNNTAIGFVAGQATTTGHITAVGSYALQNNTTGTGNTAVGGYDESIDGALYLNSTGSYNVAIGTGALKSNTTASNNTALGYQAGFTVSTSGQNTCIGYQAGYQTTGPYNTYVGTQAGYSLTSGSSNTFIGQDAGFSATTGVSNTFVGCNNSTGSAGYYVTTGSKNTILGGYNGNQGGLDIRTSSNYIVLSDGDGNPRGFFDGSGNYVVNGTGIFGSGKSNLYFASGSNGFSVVSTDNTTNASFMQMYANGSFCGNITRIGTTSAVLYGSASDYRLKDVMGSISDSGNRIDALQPINYTMKADGSAQRGFLAHQFQAIYPASVSGEKDAVDAEGNPIYQTMQASSPEVMADLIAEIQSLRKRIATLEAK